MLCSSHPLQHWDYFFNANGTDNGGNRAATVLMYLTDVEEGGETTFPNIPLPPGACHGNVPMNSRSAPPVATTA